MIVFIVVLTNIALPALSSALIIILLFLQGMLKQEKKTKFDILLSPTTEIGLNMLPDPAST